VIEWIAIGGATIWAMSKQRAAQVLDDTNNSYVTVYSGLVRHFAQAISRQEGFGIPGAVPTTANNPGDLCDPTGALFGLPLMGSESIVVFPDAASGWDALYRQIQLIADGRSSVYTLNMTIADMANHYAPIPDPATWANNVAGFLGVTPDTPLALVLT
jgi:hypothetical protein